jgi:hypothetical protein
MPETPDNAGPATTAEAALARASAAASSPAAEGAGDAPPGAAAPPASSETGPSPAGATVQPETPTDAGPIPFDRHKAILENARRQEQERVRREFEAKYGWAVKLDPDTVQQAITLARQLHEQPVEFLHRLYQELAAHPEYGRDLSGEIGPDYTDGQGAQFYSAERVRQLLEQREARLRAEIQRELEPLRAFAAQASQQAELARLVAESRALADQEITRARQSWPFFREHEKQIAEVLAAMPDSRRDAIGAIGALYEAYLTVVGPQLSAQAREQVRHEMQEKASAGAGVTRPGAGAAGRTGSRPKSVDELAERMRRMAGA